MIPSPFYARCFALALLALGLLPPSARSAVMISFSDEAGDTRVNISGSLDTSGLSFGSALSFEELNLKARELWFTGGAGDYRFAFHSLPISVWHALDANGFSYSDVSGSDFGFNDIAIAVSATYVSGTALTTSFRIDGLSLATLSPQSGVIVTLGNGDTISVSVVPEPATYALLVGAGGLLVALVRRTRRSRGQGTLKDEPLTKQSP